MLCAWGSSAEQGAAREISADPANYLRLIQNLRPGDTLLLAPGIYRRGLFLQDLHGTADRAIVIAGPPDRTAVFLGRPKHNTVELRDVSYLRIRNLTLDGRNTPAADGVKSQAVTRHITLENLEIINHGPHQQTVGISTKAPAWDWVIRHNVIRGAGTGLYLGNSDGSAPFVRGLIEHNAIADTIGYGLQIKHQNRRPSVPGMPIGRSSTIIRYNFISKGRQPNHGFDGPRPNLLVGHFPPSGPGLEDCYEIYGNLLYQNLVDEPLFQGEGNIAFHDNLLINGHGDGLWIQPHNDRPRRIAVFHNTVVATGLGIALRNPYADFTQTVAGNAVFARTPIEMPPEVPGRQYNITESYEAAAEYLKAPFASWDRLDLRPRPGRLKGPAIDWEAFLDFTHAQRDFAGNPRDGTHRGAYAGPEVPRQGHFRFHPALRPQRFGGQP